MEKRIEASLEQVKAIIKLHAPRSVKEVQRLIGKLAALNPFMSKSSDKCKVFYDLLRKNKSFCWGQEHEEAFQGIKNYFANPLLLAKP